MLKSRVTQFTVFLENKVGRFNELLGLFHFNQLRILALSFIDNTDTITVRFIINYPESLRDLLQREAITFKEQSILAVEIDNPEALKLITCGLVEAEVNTYYIYSFLIQPFGRPVMVVRCEDIDMAEDVLKKNQLHLLTQEDLAR